MAPPPAEQQSARNAAIVAGAAQQLNSLWPRVDWASARAVDAVATIYRAIVTRYGQAAAALAAEYYDDTRAQYRAPSRFRAVPADPISAEQINQIVTSSFLGHARVEQLDEPETASARTTSDLPVEQRVQQRLEGSLSRLVRQPGRDTITENVARDPAKPSWIRVPVGEKTCEFCIMLASRKLGPHFRGYHSWEAALFDENGEKYHTECDCEAVLVPPGADVHALSPNLDSYQDLFGRAADAAGTSRDFKAILAQMRQLLKDEQPAAPERPSSAVPEPRPAPVDLDALEPAPPEPSPGGGDGGEPPDPPIVVGQMPFGEDAEPPEIDEAHVLDGEPGNVRRGGHRFGTGRPGKTEFPQAWTDDMVIAAVQSAMDDPEVVVHGGDRTDYLREVDGVIVRVSTYFDGTVRRFRSGYPVNGNGVSVNPRDGGQPQPRPLNRDVIDRYR